MQSIVANLKVIEILYFQCKCTLKQIDTSPHLTNIQSLKPISKTSKST